MPWLHIREKPQNFIQPEFLEKGSAGIKEPEAYDTDTLCKMVRLFFDHQEGKVSYDKGLIFLPCGTGGEPYYPTKKGKGNGHASKPFILNIQIILTSVNSLQKPRPQLLPSMLPRHPPSLLPSVLPRLPPLLLPLKTLPIPRQRLSLHLLP